MGDHGRPPDGTAPTANERKVQSEEAKRAKDPLRGNGVARDDDGGPRTPNEPRHVDDQGEPIGEDNHPTGPHADDDQNEPADGQNPIHVQALPKKWHAMGARFKDTAAVRQHFIDLSEQPGTKPEMARFLRSVAGDDDLPMTRYGFAIKALPKGCKPFGKDDNETDPEASLETAGPGVSGDDPSLNPAADPLEDPSAAPAAPAAAPTTDPGADPAADPAAGADGSGSDPGAAPPEPDDSRPWAGDPDNEGDDTDPNQAFRRLHRQQRRTGLARRSPGRYKDGAGA